MRLRQLLSAGIPEGFPRKGKRGGGGGAGEGGGVRGGRVREEEVRKIDFIPV